MGNWSGISKILVAMDAKKIIDIVTNAQQSINDAYSEAWLLLKQELEQRENKEIIFYKDYNFVSCVVWDNDRVNWVEVRKIYLQEDKFLIDAVVGYKFQFGEHRTLQKYELAPEAGFQMLKVINENQL